MEQRLADKVAIVVGAGQTPGQTIGNGRATALLFARAGARVIAVDRRGDSAEETVTMIEREGGRGLAVEADVTSAADCARVVRTCTDHFGTVDILHNNVGIGGRDGGPVSLEEDSWQHILRVNMDSVFLMAKEVLPLMREKGRGSIINISSAAAVCATGMMAYKTSKAGVNAMTHAMAMGNARPGIRVNCIMPGLMETPMAMEGISDRRGIDAAALKEQRDRRVPLKGGMGDAWDVAQAALFLASDEAKFITGVILPVDGGQCARIG